MEADMVDDKIDAAVERGRRPTTLLVAAACYCDISRRRELVQDTDGGVTEVPTGWPMAAEEWTPPETMQDRIAFARGYLDKAEALLPREELELSEPPWLGAAPDEVEDAVPPDELSPREELLSLDREELVDRARKAEVRGFSSMNKEQLADALLADKDE